MTCAGDRHIEAEGDIEVEIGQKLKLGKTSTEELVVISTTPLMLNPAFKNSYPQGSSFMFGSKVSSKAILSLSVKVWFCNYIRLT